MSAELFLMQHTCHWYCRSRAVASARMLARHKTSLRAGGGFGGAGNAAGLPRAGRRLTQLGESLVQRAFVAVLRRSSGSARCSPLSSLCPAHNRAGSTLGRHDDCQPLSRPDPCAAPGRPAGGFQREAHRSSARRAAHRMAFAGGPGCELDHATPVLRDPLALAAALPLPLPQSQDANAPLRCDAAPLDLPLRRPSPCPGPDPCSDTRCRRRPRSLRAVSPAAAPAIRSLEEVLGRPGPAARRCRRNATRN